MRRVLRKPFLRVKGPTGIDLVQRLGPALIGVRITDHGGYDSDECIIRIRRNPPYEAPPMVGTPFQVEIGWTQDAIAMTGIYTLQRVRYMGEPERGYEMQYVCRGADFVDKAKQVDTEHFDGQNGHRTYGDVFRTLAQRMGAGVAIAPGVADIPLPGGYVLRHAQSAIDFATELGDALGVLVKPQAGRLVVRPRGVGSSATGQDLGVITIVFMRDYAFEADIEPRYQYQTYSAPWFDAQAGRIQRADRQSKRQYSRMAMPHPSPTQDGAERQASAIAQEYGRYSGTGLFEKVGDPTALAEMRVVCSGFGPGIDDVPWIAVAVTHDALPEIGWMTTVETEALETAP